MGMFNHFTHNDLDGYGSEFVVRHYLKKKLGEDYYKSYECTHLNYQELSDMTFYNCLITDLNFKNKQFKNIKSNVLLIDHHVYSDAEYKAMEILKRNNNKFIIDQSKCATKLTYEYFNNKLDISEIKWIVELINIYDMWKIKSKYWDKAFMLNEMFERKKGKRGVKFLFDVFENGLSWLEPEYNEILKGRDEFFNKLREEGKIFEYDKVVLYTPLSYDYISFYFFHSDHPHKIIVTSPTKLSIRHLEPSLDRVENALKDIKNITYGGHQEAQGVNILDGNEVTLYKVIESLIEEFNK